MEGFGKNKEADGSKGSRLFLANLREGARLLPREKICTRKRERAKPKPLIRT